VVQRERALAEAVIEVDFEINRFAIGQAAIEHVVVFAAHGDGALRGQLVKGHRAPVALAAGDAELAVAGHDATGDAGFVERGDQFIVLAGCALTAAAGAALSATWASTLTALSAASATW